MIHIYDICIQSVRFTQDKELENVHAKITIGDISAQIIFLFFFSDYNIEPLQRNPLIVDIH